MIAYPIEILDFNHFFNFLIIISLVIKLQVSKMCSIVPFCCFAAFLL